MEPEVANELKWFYKHAIDAKHEYEVALGRSVTQRLTLLFQDMVELHAQNARELALDLQKYGELDIEIASDKNPVHRPLLDSRAFIGDPDERIIDGLIDGEQRNLECYNRALRQVQMPSVLKLHLIDQQYRLDAAILDMQVMQQ
jgi:hypothetical protein